MCEKSENPECRPKQEVDFLLESTFWTLYAVQGKVQLRNVERPYDNPVFYQDTIIEQFQAKTTQYLDKNFFLFFNSVETKDSRVNFLAAPTEYTFVDTKSTTNYVSSFPLE